MRISILLLLCLFTPLLSAQNNQWKEVKSYQGRFRIMSPGPMKSKVDTVQTAVGELAYNIHYYQPPDEGRSAHNLLYMVTYCDYPQGALHEDSTELLQEFFDATMESAASAVLGEVKYDAERDYRAKPGRFWRIDYLDGEAVIKTWGIVAGRRYYSVQTITVASRSLNKVSDHFLDSFRIIDPEQP